MSWIRWARSLVVALVALSGGGALGQTPTTAFTYQGRLVSGGAPANGPHDLRFRLYDAATGGTQVGNPVCVDNVGVSDALFTVQIDFGRQFATTFPRFLEIDVRADTGLNCATGTGFSTLSPRQQLTPAPMASQAAGAFALYPTGGQSLPAVIVDPVGRVGIGTATPGKRLTVSGDMELGLNSGQYNHLRLGGGNSDGYLYGSFPHFGDGVHLGYNYFADSFGTNAIIHPDRGTSRIGMLDGSLVFATGAPFGGEPGERVRITSSGFVGIGTASPFAKLHVDSGDAYLGLPTNGWFFNTRSSFDGDRLQITDTVGGVPQVQRGLTLTKAGFVGVSTTSPVTNLDVRGGAVVSGSVGVGTTAPSAKLDVRGDILMGSNTPLFAAGGEENLRIVRGSCDGFGCNSITIIAGTGFSVAIEDQGKYLVTFTTPFAALPSVVASSKPSGCDAFAVVTNVTTSAFEIRLKVDACGTGACGAGFNFIAAGPR
jgi:hypothetical protein